MPKSCKQDEILNPKTNRCVKRTGKIGKELVAALAVQQTTVSGIYMPAYLRQQKTAPLKTLKEYIKTNNPEMTHQNVKLVHRILKTLTQEIMDITFMCSHHYRNRKDQLKRGDVLHTMEIMDVVQNDKDIPKKEDKEFTQIMEKVVRSSIDNQNVKIEPSVFILLSRVFQPWTATKISPTFLENIQSVKPSKPLEKLSLRYV